MIKYIKILFLLLTLCTYGQDVNDMKKPDIVDEKFREFIEKKKFVSENYYSGVSDEKLKPFLSKKINLIASDFLIVYQSGSPSEQKYQEKIELGLSRFESVYLSLDTEDRERICTYIEELMDIIELNSSNGLLNKFMYGFDISKEVDK
ncbi:DUF4844 domain-containing protein [Tenacibaculum sp. 1B UA]|uniref:DUF4844 domain-containing protein n=1 Tax=Tenacibaculum sp. 1B UA TaxID=2922252 RepID=UPI002A2401BA|nr:DUF4844 domain-containing protein [Tenacibaculum sp. 1B UA]MDX8553126.1 DUF4844 domain-containing protein [Tenacibaculum sp. 1B UA]